VTASHPRPEDDSDLVVLSLDVKGENFAVLRRLSRVGFNDLYVR